MWVPFDLKVVSMVLVLTLIVLLFALVGFGYWREKHEEKHYKHPSQTGVKPE